MQQRTQQNTTMKKNTFVQPRCPFVLPHVRRWCVRQRAAHDRMHSSSVRLPTCSQRGQSCPDGTTYRCPRGSARRAVATMLSDRGRASCGIHPGGSAARRGCWTEKTKRRPREKRRLRRLFCSANLQTFFNNIVIRFHYFVSFVRPHSGKN